MAIGADRPPRARRRCCSPCAAAARALYVGLAEDGFIVASEPYGVVEETEPATCASTARRRRSQRPGAALDAAARRARSTASRGSPTTAPTLPVTDADLVTAEVTTRDIDRGDSPHFLLKEISESPRQLRQDPARQDRRDATALLRAVVGERALPADDRRAPAPPARSPRVRVIGQGTAAVAGQSLADAARRAGGRRSSTSRRSRPPSCPGFGLRLDMSDTLVVAVSQCGTTTDTNRTVDLLRGRGAAVHRHRQPPRQRPHRQGRRRALHVRRARRGDERRVDQGVLRPGRGRLRCWPARSPRRPASAPTSRRHELLAVAARAARRDARGAGRAATTIAEAARRFAPQQALLGDRRQRRQQGRRRGGADQAQRALLQVDRLRRHRGQEAHRPVVASR